MWGRFNRADQNLVERVQHRATSIVQSLWHLYFEEMLRLLQLPSLYYRHRQGDMIHSYQMFRGGVDADPSNFFLLPTETIMKGHPYKISKRSAVCRARRPAFATRIVDDWNGLPTEVVCSPNVNTFKACLDAHGHSSGTYWILI